WLNDEDAQRCELWMVYVKDRLYIPKKDGWDNSQLPEPTKRFPCDSLGAHLFAYREGWTETVEYRNDDPRLPEPIRTFTCEIGSATIVATPLVLGGRNLGWMTVSSPGTPEPEHQWWRVALIEAVARQATLALHQSRLVDLNLREERRKAILE